MTTDLRLPGHFRLVLDLDGVIVDTDEIKAEVLIGLFGHLPPEVQQEIDTWNRRNRGVPRRRKIAHITATWDPKHDSPVAVASLLDRYAEALTNARPSRLLPGTELLNDLHCPLHVSSSAPPGMVYAELAQHDLSALFESVHGDPPGKVETLRLFRAAYPADAVIMIGDGGADEVAATEAGVTFVGIERETKSFSPGVATYPHLRAALTALFTT